MLQRKWPVLAALVVCQLLSSCRNTITDPGWVNTHPPYKDSAGFQKMYTKEFALDSATVLKNELFQFMDTKNTVASYNSNKNQLVFFDYTTGQLITKIDLKKAGVKRKGTGILMLYCFNVVSYDSIYFYAQKQDTIFLLDTSCHVKRMYAVRSTDNGYRQGRLINAEILPVTDSFIWVPSGPARDMYHMNAPLRENLFLGISQLTGEAKPAIAYPAIYRSAIWGDFMHRFYSAYNPTMQTVSISFPVDHNIYTFHSGGKMVPGYAGSNQVEKVEPYLYPGQELPKSISGEMDNFMSQRSYRNIFYDRYANLYYRIVSTAIPKEDLTKLGSRYKKQPFSIIILNSAMQKVGEQFFDANQYSITSAFISKEGLCIPTIATSDEKMVFDIFKPVKK